MKEDRRNGSLIRDYTSTDFPVNREFKNNQGYIANIIGRKKVNNQIIYFLQFQDIYKAVVCASVGTLRKTSFKNPYHKALYNKGYFGIGTHRSRELYGDKKKTREYLLWFAMFQRCYGENYHAREAYKDVDVCDRWHNFQFFCHDIKQLDGYEKWLNNRGEYHLDKDLIGSNKIYSKETCVFLSRAKNIGLSNKKSKITGKIYQGIRLSDSYHEYFTNQCEFAKKYNLSNTAICGCINNRIKIHKGWVFKIVDDNNV